MLPYTGDYTEHIVLEKSSLTFYYFPPRPLMEAAEKVILYTKYSIEIYRNILYCMIMGFFQYPSLMREDMYQMNNELTALLTEAHKNIGFWKGRYVFSV